MSRKFLADVVRAHADASAMLDDLFASSRQLEAARDALARTRDRFEAGVASFGDVLQSQSTLIDAQRRRVLCIAQWRSARSRMLASAGGLGHPAAGIAPAVDRARGQRRPF